MVRITRQNVQQQNRRRGGGGGGGGGLDDVVRMARAKILEKDSLAGVLFTLAVGLIVVVYVLWSSTAGDDKLRAGGGFGSGDDHPNLHLADKNSEQYNALAQDILRTLDCHKLLNVTMDGFGSEMKELSEGEGLDSNQAIQRRRRRRRRRRLEDAFNEGGNDKDNQGGGVMDADEDGKEDEDEQFDGGDDDFNSNFGRTTPTAKHLFCLAAFASDDQKETGKWKDNIKCDATGSVQKLLLDLWSTARGDIDINLLLKVLDMSYESTQTIAKKELNLWAPRDDTGLEYMLAHVNEEGKTVDQGGLYGLEKNLGHGKVFVDVGSCLGTTSMAVALLYPGTRIVSIEVASPNWFLQEVNFRCNANAFEKLPQILLTGVGPAHATTTFAEYMWKPDRVTTARSWTPQSDIDATKDVELAVRLRPWHSILAEAELLQDPSTKKSQIDVLNVDCGACEYNLIPSMTDAEFDSITTVMGGVHWGYIPKSKLPSSTRGRETHERLCKHENFARTAKECCQFPNMEVISSYPGHILVQNEDHDRAIARAGTVADVAGGLCDDYEHWSVEKHINDITSDWGWFQLTSSARDV
ncbi:hypothetical protein ACA910_012998 [Epithemia clementina (nom. ined.)]